MTPTKLDVIQVVSFEFIFLLTMQRFKHILIFIAAESLGEFFHQNSTTPSEVHQQPLQLNDSHHDHQQDSQEDDSEMSQAQCSSEKIQRGSTSIYIFERDQDCVNNVRKQMDGDKSQSMENSYPKEVADENKCGKNFKRSAHVEENDDKEETVVIVRKRGKKVFIEF